MRALLLALALALPAAAQDSPRLLLAQQPNFPLTYPEHLADNLDYLDALPFDGITVTVFASWQLMKPGWTFTAEEIAGSLSPIAGQFERLDYNFLLVTINDPGDVFDDAAWAPVLANWGALAEAARDAGFAGLFFDVEEYGTTWLNYPEDYDSPVQSLAAYRKQTRLRGQQMMEAVAAAWPEAEVLFTFGPWLSEPATPGYVRLLQVADAEEYELLGPLFVGFLEGAGPGNRIIDGGECYQYRTAEDFGRAYAWREVGIASKNTDSAFIPEALRPGWGDRVSSGFGVYNIDWKAAEGYPMNPEVMETTLRNALRRADDLVWYYNEEFADGTGNWHVPGSMPQAWTDAVVAAQQSPVGVPLGPAAVGEQIAGPFPNPTRGQATVRLRLDRAAPVRIASRDLLGRQVALVHAGPLTPGLHRFEMSTKEIPAGTYLVRLQIGDRTETRRLTVLR
ncbi:MAG: T9SS type A sorting domain-containing protein [Bacteroidota bacterium]